MQSEGSALSNIRSKHGQNIMNIFLAILLILSSFTIAFLGVVILFSIDVWIGLTLSTVGILLSLRTIGRV